MHDIGREQAEGGVHRGGIGHDDPPDAELSAEHAAEQAAGAAEGVQHEVSGVEAAFDGDLVDQVGDLRRGDAVDADGGILHAHAERLRDRLREDPPGGLGIEGDGAAEEGTRVHVANQQHDIGERGLLPAEAVADRAGPGAGARRSHARHAGGRVQRDDAAAAGTDGDHLDLGRHVVVAVDHGLAGVVDGAALDHAHLERGAAHVAGDDVLVLHEPAEMAAADDAGGGPALEHADGPLGGLLRRQQAAVALHHQQGPVVAPSLQQRLQAGDVVAGDASGIGVDDGRGCALVFAGHRRDLARERHVDIGRDLAGQLAHPLLVRGVVEGPEEGDRERLDLFILDQRADRPAHRVFVHRAQHGALVVDPLRHAPGL